MTTNWQPAGILHPNQHTTSFELTRHAPDSAVALFVERYWIIRWDLRGQPPQPAASPTKS